MSRTQINTRLLAAGGLVQVATASTSSVIVITTSIPFDDTIPQNTEGTEVLTVSITPKFSTSYLLVVGEIAGSCTTSNGSGMALFKDSEVSARYARNTMLGNAHESPFHIVWGMTAGSTSTTTFKVRVGTQGAGTHTINGRASASLYGGVIASYLTVFEIAA